MGVADGTGAGLEGAGRGTLGTMDWRQVPDSGG